MIEERALNEGWEFTEEGAEAWRPAVVPGCVQMDLLRLGDLPDPFYRMNEFEMQALEGKDWVYRTRFDLTGTDLQASEIDLVFEGLDTYAEIYLNGTFLGATENMFIPHRFDVTEVVEEGENALVVRFRSTVATIRALERNSPLKLPTSSEPARPYVRKAQYAFGWDWGPRIVQTGIWRPVRLEMVLGARVVAPFAYAEEIEGGRAIVRVEAEVDAYTDDPLDAEITLTLDGRQAAQTRVSVENRQGALGFMARLSVPDAALWWPNGLGAQPLYEARIRILPAEGGRALDERTVRFGIRQVRLLRERDVEGESFIVEINGVKVFCKGANWIPADNLLPRLTREDYYRYIDLAADAHMNMLRIWGGGIYEDPAFYEACDARGIMVWQDFMYACAQYPDELEWFQDLARDEAEEVVRRLRNHPSLVIWCGNNENNWGFDEWWGSGVPRFQGNTVYRDILPETCARLDPSRPYWTSSPYGGEHPNCTSEGDHHQWVVWSNWRDCSGYLSCTGRFVSEFGFQAMPAWRTVLDYTAPEDRTILSPVMRSHNKMEEGTERLVRFLVGRLGMPKDLQSYVYLTQFNQAEAIKTGVEHWRTRMFLTAGALYWQLNDCWPVASWSSVDHYYRKKGLYYYTKDFFAPILPVLRLEGDEVLLYGVSDLLEDVTGEARISSYHLDGTLRRTERRQVTLLGNRSGVLARFSLQDLGIGYTPRVMPHEGHSTSVPKEQNGDLLDSVLYVELTAGGRTYRNYLVFDRFRELGLCDPEIRVAQDGERIRLTASRPAFGVFVETENDVDLSHNCLNLEPGRTVEIVASGNPGAVTVHHLQGLVARI